MLNASILNDPSGATKLLEEKMEEKIKRYNETTEKEFSNEKSLDREG